MEITHNNKTVRWLLFWRQYISLFWCNILFLTILFVISFLPILKTSIIKTYRTTCGTQVLATQKKQPQKLLPSESSDRERWLLNPKVTTYGTLRYLFRARLRNLRQSIYVHSKYRQEDHFAILFVWRVRWVFCNFTGRRKTTANKPLIISIHYFRQ